MTKTATKSSSQPLPPQALANLYLQLGRMEEAGIPAQAALSLLSQAGGESGKRASIALIYLNRGRPLAEAGKRAGLFVGLDAEIIKVAEASGTHAEIYRQLSQAYEEEARWRRKIKARLVLPLTVLGLGLFINPLPALVTGSISTIGYLMGSVGVLLLLALVSWGLLRLPTWLRHGWLQPFNHLLDKFQMKMPSLRQWYARRSLRDFMRALGLMLQAGHPLLEALPKAYNVVENSMLRQQLQFLSTRLKAGDTFAQAFSQVEDMEPVAIQLVTTGDQAGKLAEMLLHSVKLESAAIDLQNEQLAAWLPRLIYALSAGWIIWGIFSSWTHTVLPEELSVQ